MASPSRRKKNSRNNMIANPNSEPSAPRKTAAADARPPASDILRVPETTHDCTCSAEIPACACSQR